MRDVDRGAWAVVAMFGMCVALAIAIVLGSSPSSIEARVKALETHLETMAVSLEPVLAFSNSIADQGQQAEIREAMARSLEVLPSPDTQEELQARLLLIELLRTPKGSRPEVRNVERRP